MRNYRVLSIVFLAALLFVTSVSCWAAANVDIAISTQAGWFGQAAADREMQLVVDTVKNKVNDIQLFPAAQQPELANWLTDHTGNKQLDILIICGQFPSSIYKPGNAQTNDSIAEKFLEGGNMIANTGDWMFYVVDGAGTNGPGGLQNMMDIPDISLSDDNTPVVVTNDGKNYTPSLKDMTTDRPFHLDQLVAPWEPLIIFAQNDAGTRADPCIVTNTETNGTIGIFFQTAGQDDDPRGVVMSEFILSYFSTTSVSPVGSSATTWGAIKGN
jgi:hypothetical protein